MGRKLNKLNERAKPGVRVTVNFYSYFKDLARCSQTNQEVAAGGTITDLLDCLFSRFPRLAPSRRSVLVAVGVEYQPRTFVLREGDEVSIFPPVQGG